MLRRMDAHVTVLDGGMGRELMRIGAPFRQPEWSALALMEGPDWVVRAHMNFIEAGAQVITTNSYALVPFHIGEERFRADGTRLAALAGALARQASPTVTVAGSLPPLFGSYLPELFDAERASSIIDPLVEGLAPNVDLWLGETLSLIAEATVVREALDRAGPSLPLWLSFTLDDHVPGTLRSGEPVSDAVSAAIDLGASAVLFNCSQSESISAAMRVAVATADGRAEVGAYANRFVAAHSDSGLANEQVTRFRDDLDPTSYCEFVADWLAAGATIVGGCCGMTPEHIAAIRALINSTSAPSD